VRLGLRGPGAAVSCALILVVLAEATLPRLLYERLDPARRYGRNPHLRRDWDNYIGVTSASHDPEIRVLLVSNSQGNGPEYPDRVIYPWLLQDALNEGRSGPPVRVVNWSFGPNRVPEAVMLLARAQDLRPHLVLTVFHPTWFQKPDYEIQGKPTPLAMFPGDVVDTAWLYRNRLPEAFDAHYVRPITAVSAVFARYWPTYRYRDLPISWLQANVPWFEAFVPEGEWAAWFLSGRARRSRLQAQPVARPFEHTPHPALMQMFADVAGRLDARRVFVFQPHYYKLLQESDVPAVVTRGLEAKGFEVWDMSHTVPWQEFLEGQNIHLADDGHRTFARALAERVRPLVDAIGATATRR
jgi:hypothetical protein